MSAKSKRGLAPAHPGEVLRDLWDDIGLTQDEFSKALGVSRQTVAQLLGGRRNISADMAHRLSRALGTSAELWMNLQSEVDLWEAEKVHRRQYGKIRRIVNRRRNEVLS